MADPRLVTVAATQMACGDTILENIATADRLVRAAAAAGAEIILIQELFASRYFCQDMAADFFDLAAPLAESPVVAHFARLAAELKVVLPVSYFERAGQSYFNSVAMVDADGTILGNYRKSHIPDGVGYSEKYYFSPGDSGFTVWPTRYARIGLGICWDQWFPEAARVMALKGAELLLYPTAIGSEPLDPGLDSSDHWQRVMQGHAGANIMPVIAANRIGREAGRQGTAITFYGRSFITDHLGAKVAELGDQEGVITSTVDLDAIAAYRRAWGVFRDRRPGLYRPILSLDGTGTALVD